jgi:hypothetical protein
MAAKSRTAQTATKPAAKTAKPSVKARTRSTAKPAARTKSVAAKGKSVAAKAAPKQSDAERMRQIQSVAKLRQSGMKWDAIAESTGLSLSALARIRLQGKNAGVAGFTR